MSLDAAGPRVEDLRILVVDDTEDHARARALRRVLEDSGFANVEDAFDVGSVEARCAAAPPDLVLLAPDQLRALRLVRDEHDREMEDRQRSGLVELEAARLEVVERLARAGEFRDDETGEHTRRVGSTAALLALAAGVEPAMARSIGLAAPLHDIGKIAIPDAILLRRGRLTGEEVRMMQRHTVIGAQILDRSSSRLLNLARDIALTHHERWDGNGYPNGFAGSRIPQGGRIVALADVFDALTHERPYKDPWPIGAAVGEIAAQAGRQFDPALVEAFLDLDHAALV